MESRSASRSSRILSLSVMRICGIDSAALIWLVIPVSFLRYSSSRSNDEGGAACTVMSRSPDVCCYERTWPEEDSSCSLSAESNAVDLLKNAVVQWQNRWYRAILIVAAI